MKNDGNNTMARPSITLWSTHFSWAHHLIFMQEELSPLAVRIYLYWPGLQSNWGFEYSVLLMQISLFHILSYHFSFQDPNCDRRNLPRIHVWSLLQLCRHSNQILGLIFCTVWKGETEREESLLKATITAFWFSVDALSLSIYIFKASNSQPKVNPAQIHYAHCLHIIQVPQCWIIQHLNTYISYLY